MRVTIRDHDMIASITADLLVYSRGRLAKAVLPGSIRERDRLIAENLAAYEADLAAYFAALAGRLGLPKDAIRKALRDPDDLDWDSEAAELRSILGRWYLFYGEAAYEAVGEQLGTEVAFTQGQPGVRRVMARLALQVSGITDFSRQVLREAVVANIESGAGTDALTARLGDIFTSWTDSRASTVALTESATAYNVSSLNGYRDSGLVDQVQIFDGPDCGFTEHNDPDLANGSIRTLDEFEEYPIAHPRCQRAGGPVAAR